MQIGVGTVVSGSFVTINWANSSYYIKSEIDPTGGSSYSINNTSQLLSVPYALQAGNAPTLQYPDGYLNANSVIFDSTTKTYTVPSGKNLYLTVNFGIIIDNDTLNSFGGSNYWGSLLVGSNQVVKDYQSSLVNDIGFLVDQSVSVILANLSKGNFVVPNGKTFILLGVPRGWGNLNINGIGKSLANNDYPQPLIFKSGTIFSGSCILNGYLK